MFRSFVNSLAMSKNIVRDSPSMLKPILRYVLIYITFPHEQHQYNILDIAINS